MSKFIMAEQNSRNIPQEDKIFGINNRAKAMEKKLGKDKVVNGSIGALLDDNGKLVVLSSVTDVLKKAEGEDYAPYAPIGGIANYSDAIKKVTFGNVNMKSHIEVVASPGGTGAIRNAIANYTKQGEQVITTDWHWANYGSICEELNRELVTFEMVENNGGFNIEALEEQLDESIQKNNRAFIILNTPAHNPTGYSITEKEWERIVKIFTNRAEKNKKIILFLDISYIDFAGETEETRAFFKKLDNLNKNILVVVGYSASKTFTFYGMRSGAAIGISSEKEIATEFKRVCEYSSRASWSNCNRLGMWAISTIALNQELADKVERERAEYRKLLEKRGKAFDEEAKKIGLKTVPFDSGFFTSIPCENPQEVCNELEKEGIFLVPLSKGIRVSVASIPEKICRQLPEKIKNNIYKINKNNI